VLERLRELAPVTAVRGNNDRAPWAEALPERARLQLGAVAIYALHNLAELDLDPAAAGIQVVISGHSHQPAIDRRGGVLFVNPGSAGPRRFKLPVTVAELHIDGGAVTARRIDIAP
jgi:putative phosphoesterase